MEQAPRAGGSNATGSPRSPGGRASQVIASFDPFSSLLVSSSFLWHLSPVSGLRSSSLQGPVFAELTADIVLTEEKR